MHLHYFVWADKQICRDAKEKGVSIIRASILRQYRIFPFWSEQQELMNFWSFLTGKINASAVMSAKKEKVVFCHEAAPGNFVGWTMAPYLSS